MSIDSPDNSPEPRDEDSLRPESPGPTAEPTSPAVVHPDSRDLSDSRGSSARRRLLRGLRYVVGWVGKALLGVMVVLICCSLLVGVTAFAFRTINPARTMFMVMDESRAPTVHQHVPLDHISRYYVAAFLLHEDDALGMRDGPYDIPAFVDRVWTYATTGEDPMGSTIPQQVVKNIYLPRGDRWYVNLPRKGLEAIVAWPFDAVVPDIRQLELYLNIAQLGPQIYGICSASWYYFNRPPWEGNFQDAIDLAGILPLGEDVVRAAGGGIDIESDGTWFVASHVALARDRLPERFEDYGGVMGAVGTLGVADTAGDHAASRNAPESCSTMPRGIAERLAAEDAWWSEEYAR